ncbi:hypothetical protein HY419_00505 [candidate division WWE3 bacterium]|nr:hypothetical protein [candidate division WWE3 bacterium]
MPSKVFTWSEFMRVSLLLHLYQPPQQNSFVLRDIARTCYLPLLKLLKLKKEFKLTVNLPLSLLEWFEKENFQGIFADLKALKDQGKVELVGSGAYHPILTKLPNEEIERQIILNESGLGYYLGRTEGFEGEPSLMIKNVRGFFPPELAFSDRLGKVLSDLSYEWCLVDQVTVVGEGDPNHVNILEGTDLGLVVRNRDLSLSLAYNRGADPSGFIRGLELERQKGVKFVVPALDGETFGHHNPEGIELLENLIAMVGEMGSFELVSAIVGEFKTKKEVKVTESSWGASDDDMKAGNIYPKWYLSENRYHEIFSTLELLLLEAVRASKNKISGEKYSEQLGNLPLWNFNKLSLVTDLTDEEKSWVKSRIMLDKALNSDKYWWSSRNQEFNPDIIKRSLELFVKVVERLSGENQELFGKVKALRDEMISLLKGQT